MEKIYLIILSGLFSIITGMLIYWIKQFSQLIKELTTYTHELKQIIVGIQTQITKGIEADISEMKTDIKELYNRTNKNENQLSRLSQKLINAND